MHCNLNQLAIFYFVVRHKKMAEAAKFLHVSKPAITMQIKRLEHWFGSPLFHREQNLLRLTEMGQALYDGIEPFFCDVDALERYIQDLIQSRESTLALGTYHLSGIYFIPDLLCHVQMKYPKLKVKLEFGTECILLEALAQGKLDMVLVTSNLPDNKRYRRVRLFDQDLVLVAAAGSKFGKLAPITSEGLADVPLILPLRDGGPRQVIHAFSSRHGVQPNVLLENISADVIKEFLLKKDAASFLVRSIAQKELDEGLLQEIPLAINEPLVIHYCFVYMETQYVPLKIKTFLFGIENFLPKFPTFVR